jgi:hypothetical protein
MLRCSYAILFHPFRLDIVRAVWSRIGLLSEVPSNRALFNQYVDRGNIGLALPLYSRNLLVAEDRSARIRLTLQSPRQR